MSHTPPNPEQEAKVARILAEYREAQTRGDAPDPKEFLARHPDLAETLRSVLENESPTPDNTHSSPAPPGGPPFGSEPLLLPPTESFPAIHAAAETGEPKTTRPSDSEGTALFLQNGSTESATWSQIELLGYELMSEIGRGGMGVVYKARQVRLNRIVALKMVIGGDHASTDDLQRFLAEAESVAALQHPHIVQVYEFGELNSLPFMALEYVDGGTLASRLKGTPLAQDVAARLMAQVARGVQVAHDAGIVHRDLKPANILLSQDDRPKITDFGLAKRVEGGNDLTRTGTIMGTPSYMAPEQAAGEGKRVGPAADVYALGANLYECLTGRPPFRASTPMDTVFQVVSEEPVPPTLVNPQVPHDLQTICLKCLEKDPKNRYASAQELAEDLERHLSGELILARSFNFMDRITRALSQTSLDASLRGWSSVLFWLAGIIFVSHASVFALVQLDVSGPLLFGVRLAQFLALVVLFWYNRSKQLLPRTSAERELWTIWAGYLIAAGTASILLRMMEYSHLIVPGEGVPRHWDSLLVYPVLSILSGLAFFAMGNNYWGPCYAFGVAFFGSALLNVLALEWAPLEFATLWGLAVTSLAVHMRQLSSGGTAQK